jgi:SAM-dependent methyltransferase
LKEKHGRREAGRRRGGGYEASARHFDTQARAYDAWFDEHSAVYESELRAVRQALPRRGRGVEIGIGSGRFAKPLGITTGVDPSVGMSAITRSRGVHVICGIAEELPFVDDRFDFVLMVTVLLFLDDPLPAFHEVYRILHEGGIFVLAFVDGDSMLAHHYERKRRERNSTFRYSRFYSVSEVERFLRKAGFGRLEYSQTIFQMPDEIDELEPVKEGYGDGSFVVVRAVKHMP